MLTRKSHDLLGLIAYFVDVPLPHVAGHYVTDVFHTGFSTWLHCDDSTVQVHRVSYVTLMLEPHLDL